jgi:hypothetical protein
LTELIDWFEDEEHPQIAHVASWARDARNQLLDDEPDTE